MSGRDGPASQEKSDPPVACVPHWGAGSPTTVIQTDRVQRIIPNRNDRENLPKAAKSLSKRSFFSEIAAARENFIPIMCASTRILPSVTRAAEEGVSPKRHGVARIFRLYTDAFDRSVGKRWPATVHVPHLESLPTNFRPRRQR